MTDFRALCAELVALEDALTDRATVTANQGQVLDGFSALAHFRDIAERARTALAQPEPQGQVLARVVFDEGGFNCPSDVVLRQYCDDWFNSDPERTEVDPVDLCRGAIRLFAQGAVELPAALAQPEPDGPAVPDGREPASVAYQPTDKELLELMPETMRDEFSYAAKVCSDATGGQVKPGIFRVCLNHSALEYARAVLARWGNQ
jgi:hypothetical protein